jgi:hypothetical protein
MESWNSSKNWGVSDVFPRLFFSQEYFGCDFRFPGPFPTTSQLLVPTTSKAELTAAANQVVSPRFFFSHGIFQISVFQSDFE